MAQTPEGKVKAKVKKILDKLGAYYTMPVTGGYGKSGAPDFVVCLKGMFIGIECKAGNNTLTALQYKARDNIVTAGGEYLVVNEQSLQTLEFFLVTFFLNK